MIKVVTIKICDECQKQCEKTLIGIYINKEIKFKELTETSYVEGEPYANYNDFDFCSRECFEKWYSKNKGLLRQ